MQGREICLPVPGPPNIFNEGKLTGMSGFAFFVNAGKSCGPSGPKISENEKEGSPAVAGAKI